MTFYSLEQVEKLVLEVCLLLFLWNHKNLVSGGNGQWGVSVLKITPQQMGRVYLTMIMMMLMTVRIFLIAWIQVHDHLPMRGCTTIETYSQTPFVEQRLFASFVKILSERSTTVWNEANDPAERVIPLFSFLNCSLTEYLPSCPAQKSWNGRKARVQANYL